MASGTGLDTFKKHFQVTGVDISEDMLSLAKELNPEIEYIHGDMRTIDLGRKFDAVAIPDSIDYMKTKTDLEKLIRTANNHLNPGGVLLIVAHPKETFKENNFVYTGEKGDIEITVFENNHILNSAKTKYEAIFIYLIRQNCQLKIYSDRHVIGLFSKETWFNLFKDKKLQTKDIPLENSYDEYILGDTDYPQSIFVCVKPLI